MLTSPYIHKAACSFDQMSTNSLQFGFDISSMSLVIGTSQYVNFFNNPDTVRQGGVTASMAGGSGIGAIMAGPISNRVGRRDSILFACGWCIVFSYILVLAYSLTLAPIAWVYAAEVRSLETRATGMAMGKAPFIPKSTPRPDLSLTAFDLASVSNWLFKFGIGFMIPPGFANIN